MGSGAWVPGQKKRPKMPPPGIPCPLIFGTKMEPKIFQKRTQKQVKKGGEKTEPKSQSMLEGFKLGGGKTSAYIPYELLLLIRK